MGQLQRITTMIRANLNDMISHAEDPQRMLNQVIYDMQAQAVEAKKTVALAIASERRSRRELDNHISAAAHWEKRAMLAIGAGDDVLARQALHKKNQHDELVQAWHNHWAQEKQGVDALRAALQGLANKIDHADRQRRMFAARIARANAQVAINRTLSTIEGTSPWGTLQRMEDRVLQIESQAEATAELTSGAEDSLESQFRALEAGGRVEDQLMALKQQMGLPPTRGRRSLPA